MCCIDNEKSFDTVNHDNNIDMLKILRADGNDIRKIHLAQGCFRLTSLSMDLVEFSTCLSNSVCASLIWFNTPLCSALRADN